MRYKVRFITEDDVLIDLNYTMELSKAIRGLIDTRYLQLIDNGGFAVDGKIFKPYTYSRLMPHNYEIENGKLLIKKGYVDIVVSSIDENFIFCFLEGLLKEKRLCIYDKTFAMESIMVKKFYPKKKMVLKTLSPVLVKTSDGIFDFKRVSDSLKKNLVSKILVFKKRFYDINDFELYFIEEKVKETTVMINNTPVRAYNGLLFLSAEEDVVDVVYHAGVGIKNALGFGCVEDVKSAQDRVIYKIS